MAAHRIDNRAEALTGYPVGGNAWVSFGHYLPSRTLHSRSEIAYPPIVRSSPDQAPFEEYVVRCCRKAGTALTRRRQRCHIQGRFGSRHHWLSPPAPVTLAVQGVCAAPLYVGLVGQLKDGHHAPDRSSSGGTHAGGPPLVMCPSLLRLRVISSGVRDTGKGASS